MSTYDLHAGGISGISQASNDEKSPQDLTSIAILCNPNIHDKPNDALIFHDIILHRFDIWKHDVCGLWTVLRDFSEATCAETICRSAQDLWRGVLVRPLQWLVPYIRVHVLQFGDM